MIKVEGAQESGRVEEIPVLKVCALEGKRK